MMSETPVGPADDAVHESNVSDNRKRAQCEQGLLLLYG